MYLVVTASKDTYITNKILENQFSASDANLGRAGSLDIFKLYDENKLNGTGSQTEVSRALIQFDFKGKILELMSGTLNLNHSSFKAKLVLSDVKGSQFSPPNFKLILFPLSKSFDEGNGRDVTSFADLDRANWITSSYSNATEAYWAVTGANKLDSDIIASGNLSDGDGVKNLFITQQFDEGNEDLQMDVTTIVSATVAGIISDHGFRISFSGTQETDSKTRFVKRFASRHVSNRELIPKIVVTWDDTVFDHHKNFYFDTSGSIFLNNFHRSRPAEILSGTYGDPVTGSNCILIRLMTGSYTKWVTASQHQAGTRMHYTTETYNYVTGVYSATFAIPANDSTTTVDSDSIRGIIAKSGSVNFDVHWFSLDKNIVYHTGSLTIKKGDRTSYDTISRDLQVRVINMRSTYRQNDIAKFRIFANDIKATQRVVKLPVKLDPVVLDEIYYRVRDADSKKIIVPFMRSNNGTRVSTDGSGMFFKVRMDTFDVGRTYTFDFLVIDRDIEQVITTDHLRFRVDN
jgi:hypothetical protein